MDIFGEKWEYLNLCEEWGYGHNKEHYQYDWLTWLKLEILEGLV